MKSLVALYLFLLSIAIAIVSALFGGMYAGTNFGIIERAHASMIFAGLLFLSSIVVLIFSRRRARV